MFLFLIPLKLMVYMYTILTLPLYFLFQRPWVKLKRSRAQHTRPLDPGNPATAWIRMGVKPWPPEGSIYTVDKYFERVVAEYGEEDLFGIREVLREEIEEHPDGKTFKKLTLGVYKWISYNEAMFQIYQLSRSLLALGAKPKETIAIYAETRCEWMLIAQAAFRINLSIGALYSYLGEEGVTHCIKEIEPTILITSEELMPKVKAIFTNIPSVKHIVYMEGMNKPDLSEFPDNVNILAYSDFYAIGPTVPKEVKGEPPQPDDLALIIYTSGSTGKPKGVMLSHKQLMTACNMVFNSGLELRRAVAAAYLPQAHVLEFCSELGMMAFGARIGYSSPHTLTDKSTAILPGQKGDIALIRPTLLLVVPIVLERFRKTILEAIEEKGVLFKAFFKFCISYKETWVKWGFSTPLIDKLIFGKMKAAFGGRICSIATGGAPISDETFNFARLVLCPQVISSYYGLSEAASCGLHTNGDDITGNTAYYAGAGALVRLVSWKEGGYTTEDQPRPRGELVLGGDCVALGYYKNPELNEGTFVEEKGVRWLFTGDIAEMWPDGHFIIIDRKKDLVKLQYGEYVSLGKVECELKSCPALDNICVYGDSLQTFVVALIVPNEAYLKTQVAKMSLSPDIPRPELCANPRVNDFYLKVIKEYSKKVGLHSYEVPQRVTLVSEEWTPESGMVTSSLKLRRAPLAQKYKQSLEKMYQDKDLVEFRP